jgi:hypothetical protein
MSDTTNIMDLPTEPVGGGNVSNNISLSITERNQIIEPNSSGQQGVSLDQTTINQIVNGLQQASATGATLLPSRNIPQMTTPLTQDPNIQPNYIPQPPTNSYTNDYIKDTEYEMNEEILRKYNKNRDQGNSLDDMYNEIQNPFLLAVLYFLFQLPFFRKLLFQYFPVLFHKDGNFNLTGFVFSSTLFGFVYYFLEKIMGYTNRF